MKDKKYKVLSVNIRKAVFVFGWHKINKNSPQGLHTVTFSDGEEVAFFHVGRFALAMGIKE